MDFIFDAPLVEGVIAERKNRFVMSVQHNGEMLLCHCPTTERIGIIHLNGRPCLLSKNPHPNRKTCHTVEAISLQRPEDPHKSWIGINQTRINRYVEYFLKNRCFPKMALSGDIRREQRLGSSKIDFLVGGTYLEVKTPLHDLQMPIPPWVKTREATPCSYIRQQRQIADLTGHLQAHQRAILLVCCMYHPYRPMLQALYESIKTIIHAHIVQGVDIWQANFTLTPTKITLKEYFRIRV
jgi:sugar fermentation stimulation protein A